MYRFVVNVRDGGRCHLVSQKKAMAPKQEMRSVCGWRFGSAVSLAFTKTSHFGPLCRRCFPKGIALDEEGSASPIEQYAD